IRTIEGFDDDALMAQLRRAFAEAHALQCGYCTPGMLIAARDLVRRKYGLNRSEIRAEMSGNLCRCTGYAGIVDAIERVMAAAALEPAGNDRASSWLGPAPGPVALPRPAQPPTNALGRAAEAPAPRLRSPARARPPIDVSVRALEQVG